VAKDTTVKPDGTIAQKPSIGQTMAAMIGGIIAVKLATYVVTTMWRLVTREDPPQVDMNVSAGKKAAWIALVGAVTGGARQLVRDKIMPPVEGAA